MRPHQSDYSQRAQDVVDDLFDLGLILFALVWGWTEVQLDTSFLAKMAIGGAGVRAIFRRLFRTFFGPQINRWVQARQTRDPDPSGTG